MKDHLSVVAGSAATNGHGPVSRRPSLRDRPRVAGKFLFAGDEKLFVRGVTYGPFAPNEDGEDYPSRDVVAADFALMAASGANTVRTYTVPPRWLLDLALEHHLYVLVGIPWEQHLAFLDERGRPRSIERRVREAVRACAGHPSVLGYAVGNEIPAPIVRWHGRRRVERFLERLYNAAKGEDPGALVTYVNFPTTEYLQLPFLDFVCFNVYLEDEELYGAYLARLQNVAGERPLVIAEIGFDSRRTSEEIQELVLGWQVRGAFSAGAAGAVVFAWTDEWHTGGYDVADWDFGLVDRERRPKRALTAVRSAFADAPFHGGIDWPRISVVVCTYNGAATLRECLTGLTKLDYPDYEVIVVDDGSTDDTAEIASEFPVQLVRSPNLGLANARNLGIEVATGDIVAFTDDDAWPDEHWLTYLASTFETTPHVGVGGPNIAPADEGTVARCVSLAPGGPQHVLITDRDAEHIPGCNMAFRRSALLEIGCFDPQFRVAGDDVDICWRLQERGWTIGFSPAALVWHRRRGSVRAYLKQQLGYGKAEALLERKWPEKYNRGGHPSWQGRVYGGTDGQILRRRWRIYYGTWGVAPFQSIYERSTSAFLAIPLMPEWYLLVTLMAAIAIYAIVGRALVFHVGTDVPLTLVLALAAPIAVLGLHAIAASWFVFRSTAEHDLRVRMLTTVLHVLQPPVRMLGRLVNSLTPWRRHGAIGIRVPWPRRGMVWSEQWRSASERLQRVEWMLKREGAVVVRGGEFARWDVRVRASALGAAELNTAVEEYGGGRQLVRFRASPHISAGIVMLMALLLAAVGLATTREDYVGTGILAAVALFLAWRTLGDCGSAIYLLVRAVESEGDEMPEALVERAHALARRPQPAVPLPQAVAASLEPDER
jgi:GT2 family glycosyltransferase